MSCCIVPLLKNCSLREHTNILWCICKIKFLLALFIDMFERRFKVICPSVHFSNLYWCFVQELSTSRLKRQGLSPPGASLGGITQADVNNPYIQEITTSALAEIDGQSNALYRQKVLRIVEAQQQVCLLIILYLSGCVLHCLLQ